MPYNPSVNDRSGEILAQHQINAANMLAGAKVSSAETRAAGNEALTEGIVSGVTSAVGGLSQGMTKARENSIKYDTAAGMLDTYKENAGALGLDLDMLGGIEQKYAKDPDKLIGALTVVGKIGENNLDIQKAQKTYEALGNAYAGKAAATAAAKAALPDKMNAETIRSYARDAAAQGATQDQIKAGLLNGFGQWAVDAVFPQAKQGFWGP
jgi:hypothetical protein